jgi:hypothetical protein
MANSQFYWTSEEVLTKSGFYVAPANANPASEEISFLVVRIDDERSSDLCKKIERMSLSNGGIVFRGDGGAAIEAGFSSAYHTGLFHENCRCRLIVKPRSLQDELDVLDFEMAANSSVLSYNEQYRAEKKLEDSQFKQYTSPSFKSRVREITSINFNGRFLTWLKTMWMSSMDFILGNPLRGRQ